MLQDIALCLKAISNGDAPEMRMWDSPAATGFLRSVLIYLTELDKGQTGWEWETYFGFDIAYFHFFPSKLGQYFN